jgi:CBS domain-containing protein
MVLEEMNRQLYESLKDFRNRDIKELIEPPIVTDVNATVSQIIGILTEKNTYDIFIHFAGTAVVDINIRDILSARDIANAKPSILGKRIPTLADKDTIGHAARIMSLYRLRALPVIESHRNDIIGQISAKAIVKAMYDANITEEKIAEAGKIRIFASSIMTLNPVTITTKDRLSIAKGIMIRRRIDHLPVVEAQQKGPVTLKGILTSKHVVEAMLPLERIGRKSLGIDNIRSRLDMQVIGMLDKNVTLSTIDDSIHSLSDLMLSTDSTYTVVKSFDEIQGIITYRDIIALLGEQVEHEIPAFFIGLPDDPFDAELAKSKFTNLIKFLSQVSPEIEQARCRMKLRDIQGERRRYEVDVNIITPYIRHTYTNMGWDLAKMFDQMSDSLKNQLAHRRSKRQKGSVRHLTE